jgi:predicted PurR-regulated permease PerM
MHAMSVDVLRLVLGLVALAVLIVGVAVVLSPFASAIAWSLILASATWPAYRRLRTRLGDRRNLAALLMTLGLTLVVLLPTAGLSVALVRELEPLLDALRRMAAGDMPEMPGWVEKVPILRDQAQELVALAEQPAARREWLRGAAGQLKEVVAVGRDVLRNVAMLFLTLFTAFFVYRDGETLLGDVHRLLDRIAGGRARTVTNAVRGTVKAVFYGWLMTAAAQGLVAIVGYWIAGLRAPVLLGVATGFVAVIPFGVGLVWVPVVAVLVYQAAWWKAIFLTIWFLGFVGLIDNFLRPLFISGPAQVPFILVFFGVLGGLAAFGLIGLVLGPVLLAVLLALWRQAGDLLGYAGGDGPAEGPAEP